MEEIWRDIKGYEGLYQVSNLGRVKSLITNKYLKPGKDGKGYLRISLVKDKNARTHSVHRLVAQHFIINQENKKQVNHINGIKDDNRIENLEWCTCKENIEHSWKNGLSKVTDGMVNHCKKYAIPIQQLDKKEKFIKKWESASEAGRILNISQQSIVACLKGRTKTAGGYKWKYDR